MAKKKRKSGKYNKGFAGGIVALLCIVGVILIFAIGSEGDFKDNLQRIWENTVNGLTGQEVSRQAQELADLERHGDKLIMYAIDTGNSDSIVIRTPEGASMLVDAADTDDSRAIASTLRALEIEKLDVAVATHAHADHIGSMAGIIEEFRPDVLYMPEAGHDTSVYKNMLKAAGEADVKQESVAVPYEFMLGSAHVRVLSPLDKEYADLNDTSVVLLVTYGNSTILLTGDMDREAMADILEGFGGQMDIDVLKVGHHGSANSTSREWLDETTPEIAVITVGENNDYNHPHRETMELLEEDEITVLRTDEDGDIAVFTDGEEWAYAIAS